VRGEASSDDSEKRPVLFTTIVPWVKVSRGGIFKLVNSTGIDYKESNTPADVAYRAGTTTLFLQSSGGGIFKLLRSSRIDSKAPIPPGCVAWRAGTTNLFLLGS
jgi:hypothetical protein